MTVPIIPDVDTGVIDACVLLATLHPDLEVCALTFESGKDGHSTRPWDGECTVPRLGQRPARSIGLADNGQHGP